MPVVQAAAVFGAALALLISTQIRSASQAARVQSQVREHTNLGDLRFTRERDACVRHRGVQVNSALNTAHCRDKQAGGCLALTNGARCAMREHATTALRCQFERRTHAASRWHRQCPQRGARCPHPRTPGPDPQPHRSLGPTRGRAVVTHTQLSSHPTSRDAANAPDGSARTSCAPNATAMATTRTPTIASNRRKPLACSASSA